MKLELFSCLAGEAQRCVLLCGQSPFWLPQTLLLMLEYPKVMSPRCDKLRESGRELHGS